ncbi:GH12356 [Drosophila grimshawi]|uniref:GH12356 n=1 Tax=Drosophila grimshawi TaxID=7222 RepID=B4JJ17_DROGR|nr:GH12356 [Drosophila grimshawi]
MRIFVGCPLFALCFKRHLDDEQTLADLFEQQPPTHSKVEQPEPETVVGQRLQLEPEPESEPELTTNTIRARDAAALTKRGSHSPARLEELNICADVHPNRLPAELMRAASPVGGATERYSSAAIKNEIEIYSDVELGNGALYFAY